MKKFIILIIIISALFNSCRKEPEIYSKEYLDYIANNVHLQYEGEEIIPKGAYASINDSSITISVIFADSTGSYDPYRINLITNNTNLGTTIYDQYSKNKWCLSVSGRGESQTYNNNYFLRIDNINTSDHTMSGELKIHDVTATFTDLSYSNTISSNFMFSYCKMNILDNNTTNYTGAYSTNHYRYYNYKHTFYLNPEMECELKFSNTSNGTYSFTTSDIMKIEKTGAGYYQYIHDGEYIISDTIIYNHSFKKYKFDVELYRYSDTISIYNAEFLKY